MKLRCQQDRYQDIKVIVRQLSSIGRFSRKMARSCSVNAESTGHTKDATPCIPSSSPTLGSSWKQDWVGSKEIQGYHTLVFNGVYISSLELCIT